MVVLHLGLEKMPGPGALAAHDVHDWDAAAAALSASTRLPSAKLSRSSPSIRCTGDRIRRSLFGISSPNISG